MWSASPALVKMLARSHELVWRVDVVRDGELVGSEVPIISSTVNATVTSTDGRTASLVVSRDVTDDDGLLDPLSDFAIIRCGIPKIEMIPLFTGRVDATVATSTGDVA